MPWGRLDDKLHENSKAWAAGTASMGLWVLANSWCCDNLQTDGFVPLRVLQRWSDQSIGDDVESAAEQLVDAGLWHRSVQGRDHGFLFHDWDQYRPGSDRASIDARRGNHVRWHANIGVVKDDCEFCQSPDVGAMSGRDRGDIVRSSPDVEDELSTAKQPPVDMTDQNVDANVSPSHSTNDRVGSGRIAPESLPNTRNPNTRIPDAGKTHDQPPVDRDTDPADFERFWDAYPRHIGKGQARKAWKTATKKTNPDAIIFAASEFTARVGSQNPRFIPHPATWLNGERWTDEPDPDFIAKSSRQQDTDSMFDRQMARAVDYDQQHPEQKAIGA